jgi:hypothetical protein
MSLYREAEQGFTQWNGERIDGVLYPLNIEQMWPGADLAAIGLYQPLPSDPVPPGKVMTATRVERVNGAVKFVNDLDDAPAYLPSTPHIFAMGRFSVGEWEISAISVTIGIAAATFIDTGIYWLDFYDTQADTDYIALTSSSGKAATVTERYESFCVVECIDQSGQHADPSDFVIQLTKVI